MIGAIDALVAICTFVFLSNPARHIAPAAAQTRTIMPTLIIGSTAMAEYLPGRREPKDFDTFSDDPRPWSSAHDIFWHDSFYKWLGVGHTPRVATLDELYTIKVSHSYWELPNGSWDKHMSDIVALKNAGAQLDLGLHDLLYSVWEEKHGRKRVNLKMTKDDFFSDAVTRIYDHDSIHDSVAYGDVPVYDSMLVDGKSVAMDMAAIKALPFETQVRLYREEIYATALERWVIPTGYKISPRKAYAWAARKTIVSLTKGWSARFLVENYEIFRKPDMDYVAHHKSKAHKLVRLEQ
jgi:hypothetical protein